MVDVAYAFFENVLELLDYQKALFPTDGAVSGPCFEKANEQERSATEDVIQRACNGWCSIRGYEHVGGELN